MSQKIFIIPPTTASSDTVFKFNFETKEVAQGSSRPVSKAVCVVAEGGNGHVIYKFGQDIECEIDVMGSHIDDLGLGDCPVGVHVWEGNYRCNTYHTMDGTDYDSEPIGTFRDPTVQEWDDIRCGVNPWTSRDNVQVLDDIPQLTEEESKVDWGLQLQGDCVAQCLNCVRQGKQSAWGHQCSCGDICLLMDSSRIREAQREYENSIENNIAAMTEMNEVVEAEFVHICECGGEKAGTTHSTWCPKHE